MGAALKRLMSDPVMSRRIGSSLGVEASARSRIWSIVVLLPAAALACLAIVPIGAEGAPATEDRRPLVLGVDGFSPQATAPLVPQRAGSIRSQYLQPDLQRALPTSAAVVTWFEWNGDVFYTNQVVKSLEARILTLIAERGERSIAIVTHSWGGVLAYLALRNLEQSRRISPAAIDLLLTIHSPLGALQARSVKAVPLKGVVAAYVDSTLVPLVSVKRWENYFSTEDQDAISWPVSIAQENIYTGRDHTTSHTDPAMQAKYAKAILDAASAAGQGAMRAAGVTPQAPASTDHLREVVGQWRGEVPPAAPNQREFLFLIEIRRDGTLSMTQRFINVNGDPVSITIPGRVMSEQGTLVYSFFKTHNFIVSSDLARIGTLSIRGVGDSRVLLATNEPTKRTWEGQLLETKAWRQKWDGLGLPGLEQLVGQWRGEQPASDRGDAFLFLMDIKPDGMFSKTIRMRDGKGNPVHDASIGRISSERGTLVYTLIGPQRYERLGTLSVQGVGDSRVLTMRNERAQRVDEGRRFETKAWRQKWENYGQLAAAGGQQAKQSTIPKPTSLPVGGVQALAGKWVGTEAVSSLIVASHTMVIKEDRTYETQGHLADGKPFRTLGRITGQSETLRWAALPDGKGGPLTLLTQGSQRMLVATGDTNWTMLLRPEPDVAALESAANREPIKWVLSANWSGSATGAACSGPDNPRANPLWISVSAEVPNSVDLLNDRVVRQVLTAGKVWAVNNCPPAKTRSAQTRGFQYALFTARYQDGRNPAIDTWTAGTTSRFSDLDPNSSSFQYNHNILGAAHTDALQQVHALERLRVVAAQQRQQQAEAERAEALKRGEAARVDAFKRKARVEAWLDPSEFGAFSSNPFPWKGKIVGFYAAFVVMRSESSAIFDLGLSNYVVMSSIPSARFTHTGQRSLIAGRVQGITNVSVPLFGTVPVPEITMSAVEDVPR